MKKVLMGLVFIVVLLASSCSLIGNKKIDFSDLHVNLSNASFIGSSSEAVSTKSMSSSKGTVFADSEYERLVQIDENGVVRVIDYFDEDGNTVSIEYNLYYFEVKGNFTFAVYYTGDDYENVANDLYYRIRDSRYEIARPGYFYDIGVNFSDKHHPSLLESLLSDSYKDNGEIQTLIIHNQSGKVFDFNSINAEHLSSIDNDGNVMTPAIMKSSFQDDSFYLFYGSESRNLGSFSYNYNTDELDYTNFSTEVEIQPYGIDNYGSLVYKQDNTFHIMKGDYETFIDLDMQEINEITNYNNSLIIYSDKGIVKYDKDLNLVDSFIIDSESNEDTFQYNGSELGYRLMREENLDYYLLNSGELMAINLDTLNFEIVNSFDNSIIAFVLIDESVLFFGEKEIFKYETKNPIEKIYDGDIIYTELEIKDSYFSFQVSNNLSLKDVHINVVTSEIYEDDEVKPVVTVTNIQPIN